MARSIKQLIPNVRMPRLPEVTDEPDVFAGVLRASGAGFPAVRTVLAFQVDPDMYTLRIEASRLGGPLRTAGEPAGGVADAGQVKHDDVGIRALPQHPAVADVHDGRRQ